MGPGQAAGCVEKPMIECITSPAAQRRDEVELFGHCAGGRGPSRDNAVIEKIRERDISFHADKQPRRQQIIVAELQSAKEAAKGNAVRCRVRIEQIVAAMSSAVSDVAA